MFAGSGGRGHRALPQLRPAPCRSRGVCRLPCPPPPRAPPPARCPPPPCPARRRLPPPPRAPVPPARRPPPPARRPPPPARRPRPSRPLPPPPAPRAAARRSPRAGKADSLPILVHPGSTGGSGALCRAAIDGGWAGSSSEASSASRKALSRRSSRRLAGARFPSVSKNLSKTTFITS